MKSAKCSDVHVVHACAACNSKSCLHLPYSERSRMFVAEPMLTKKFKVNGHVIAQAEKKQTKLFLTEHGASGTGLRRTSHCTVLLYRCWCTRRHSCMSVIHVTNYICPTPFYMLDIGLPFVWMINKKKTNNPADIFLPVIIVIISSNRENNDVIVDIYQTQHEKKL